MNVYEIGNMGEKLANNTYPGRGIVLGITLHARWITPHGASRLWLKSLIR